MLDGRDHALILAALGLRHAQTAGQVTVLRLHILIAPEMPAADDIHLRSEQIVSGARRRFRRGHRAEFIGHILIPGTAQQGRLRQPGRLHHAGDTSRPVIHDRFRNAQTGHPPLIPRIADFSLIVRLLRTAQQRKLLFHGHGVNQRLNFLIPYRRLIDMDVLPGEKIRILHCPHCISLL